MKRQKYLKRFLRFIQRENLHRLLLIIAILLVISTVGLAFFETGIGWTNALWWSIVTLTTVGYGDIAPTTFAGRIIGVVVMIFGIGMLGMFTATIASIFVEKKLKENRGMKSFKFENHTILCEWNHRTAEILRELRSDKRMEGQPVILIANEEMKPADDEDLHFIKGDITEENLKRANLEKAKTVVVLGDETLDANARDAQVVLAALTVESMNPDVYTIVELVNESNVRHCKRANADEIIVGDEFSSRLISRAALDHGISLVLSELLSSRYGNEIYKIPLPPELGDKNFIEIFTEMKSRYNSIVLAIQKGSDDAVISNPPSDHPVAQEDFLIIISNDRPGETKAS
jgi:voltage-gated potassium channel